MSLTNRIEAATDLRVVVDDQEDELELMRRNRVLEQGARESGVSSAFHAEFQEGLAQQQREMAELWGLVQVCSSL